jgi:uncharacterized protein DUF3551
MRYALIGAAMLTAAAVHAQPAQAQSEYRDPWCIEDQGGGLDCSFRNFEQCRVTQQGQGGDCVPNPFAASARGFAEPRAKPRSRHRHR